MGDNFKSEARATIRVSGVCFGGIPSVLMLSLGLANSMIFKNHSCQKN
jgi:hypothetical protein